jgi:hypothetical protein
MKHNHTTMLRMRRLGRKVPSLRMVGFRLLVWTRSRLSNPTRRCDKGESLVQLSREAAELMSEWLKEHAWKTKRAADSNALRRGSTHTRSAT